ncbi:alpha/beta hydrolase [Fibrella sp. HMF5335]|uniref:Alpha/beta hydrolase n=1 Tax=Fibrella rubiginis TaxID=2817060 RepID=A0A939GLW6_9BACT|nr:alpha/beta hydrolase [Fibrella rubiginis]MBO0938778.1 alpha/beta hydrolase [Fibrella rubiginis]
MKRPLQIAGGLLLLLVIVYMLGPRPQFEPVRAEAPVLKTALSALEKSIIATEQQAGLKPDNDARIVWADSLHKQKTAVSMVYIPGFGASWAEGDPVHKRLAKHFGCNLYLARPYEHGLKSPDAFKKLTPAAYAASAEQALAVGRLLGNRVVVVGTSAGGMLSLYLATHHPDLAAVVLYSPCVAVANPALALATMPWGREITNLALGDEHVNITHYKPDRARYWLTRYHTNGLITLQTMIDTYMTPGQFAQVKQPLFMGYYYKDEDHQDKVVSVPAMLTMFDQLGTPADKKVKTAFPRAGDHVIASHFTSGELEGVYRATEFFLNRTVGLVPVSQETSLAVH